MYGRSTRSAPVRRAKSILMVRKVVEHARLIEEVEVLVVPDHLGAPTVV